MFRSALAFMKKETVLTAAAALALLSMFLVPPDAQYAGYIDFDTLALLFSLTVSYTHLTLPTILLV